MNTNNLLQHKNVNSTLHAYILLKPKYYLLVILAFQMNLKVQYESSSNIPQNTLILFIKNFFKSIRTNNIFISNEYFI